MSSDNERTHLPEPEVGLDDQKILGDYPTEATSGAGQRHHQVVEVDEVIDRVMSGGTVSAGWDGVKTAPAS